MAYIFVNSFKQGLDARRSKISAQQGSLVRGNNVHINRGGEIEKRKAFVPRFTLPAGTHGLHATRSGVYVFGSIATPTGLPVGIRYQRLQAPSSPAMVEVVSADSFGGSPYVVARFDDGSVHHFYNGDRVGDWDSISAGAADIFTLGRSLADVVSRAPGVSATYSAIAGMPTITITADAANTAFTLSAGLSTDTAGNNSTTITNIAVAGPGVAQVAQVALNPNGTTAGSESTDAWTITVNGTAYTLATAASGTGSSVRTHRSKIYATVQGLLYFCDTDNATIWKQPVAPDVNFSGFESLGSQTGQADALVAMAPYQNWLAVFARRATQVWAVVAGDPVGNVPVQILDNIGTFAPRSTINFGELDVFFLSDTGIRSLRARDASNAATVFDVGTNIDPLVIAQLGTLTEEAMARACGVIDPGEGRYMLAIGGQIFVYSFFPASGISAWTTYETGFAVSEWAVQNSRLFARAGDQVYLYGGDDGLTYDSCEAAVALSWLDADKAGHRKRFHGLDVSCEGTWHIEYSTDPVTDQFVQAGCVVGQTFSLPSFGIAGHGTHIGFKFTSHDASPAKLSAFACHFEFADPPK